MKKLLFSIAAAFMIIGCNQKVENKAANDNPASNTESTKNNIFKCTLNPQNGFYYERNDFIFSGYFYKTYGSDNTGFGYTHTPAEGFPANYGKAGSFSLGYLNGTDPTVQNMQAYDQQLQIVLPYDATVTVTYNFSVLHGTNPVSIYLNNSASMTNVKSKEFTLQTVDKYGSLSYTCQSVNKGVTFFFQCRMPNADYTPLWLFSVDIEVKK